MLRFAAALLLITAAASKTPDNVSSKLMIHIPEDLRKSGGYDHREALFGVPRYGGSITQTVYYADDTLCDPNVDMTKGYPKRPEIDGKMEPWQTPFILMVDRGGCTFVRKVRNAQKSGAAGVIIADNVCLCSDNECKEKTGNSVGCENSEPIMADDGSGSDITIPSFLMFKHDADDVKAKLKNDIPVQVEMAWSLPSPDARVEYDLWTIPTDVVSREFLKGFKDAAVALGKHAYFSPHMYVYDGVRSHCQGNDGVNMCYNLCTNNGRYCATDPDSDLEKGISGSDVVKESLRRICIWKTYGEQDGIGEPWWNYVNEFMKRCNTADYFSNPDCIKDAYRHAKIDGALVDNCISNSGGLQNDSVNAFLDLEVKEQKERGVVVLPTAFVNTAAIRGALTVNNVFTAICAGFKTNTQPPICQRCAGCVDPSSCISSGGSCKHSGNGGGTISANTFAVSMAVVIAAFVGIGIWHYKKTKDEMRDQVRGILAEYMPLDGEDGEVGSPMDFAQKVNGTSLIS